MTIKMIVFDMAGTTVDEDNIVYKTVLQAITEAGFDDITLAQVLEQGAGKEKLQAIKSVLQVYANNHSETIAQNIYQNFINLLSRAYATEDIFPQPNAQQTLSSLKQNEIIRVLNTGYDKDTATALLHKLGWQKGVEYDLLVTAGDVEKGRPQPDMIFYAMQQFGITDAGQVIKVGDSVIDIEEGKNAGCILSIGITTGAHTYEQLKAANPDYIINDLSELLPLLNG